MGPVNAGPGENYISDWFKCPAIVGRVCLSFNLYEGYQTIWKIHEGNKDPNLNDASGTHHCMNGETCPSKEDTREFRGMGSSSTLVSEANIA